MGVLSTSLRGLTSIRWLVTVASHQPQRWWYAYVYLDDEKFDLEEERDRTAIMSHEMGHTLGLGHQPDPKTSGGEPGCKLDRFGRNYSVMDIQCLEDDGENKAFAAKAVDVCGVNQLNMYGNDPGVPLHGCVGVSPPYG